MILTTEQAADELGVSPARVRQLVMAGDLEPFKRGAKPLRFRLDDVIDCEARRRTRAEQDRLVTLAERWRDEVREVC